MWTKVSTSVGAACKPCGVRNIAIQLVRSSVHTSNENYDTLIYDSVTFLIYS